MLREGDRGLREHLVATTERMISERGTAGLTVRAIAREVGVADGVLYNYFADKEELLAEALRAHVRSVERGLGELPEPGGGTIAGNLRAHIEYGLAMHRAILPAFAGLLAQPKVLDRFAELGSPGEDWRDRLRDHLRAERELGRLRVDAQVDAAAAMIAGVCHETALTLLFRDTAPPMTAADIDDLITVVLGGILG
ncbi:DNA-binding transcriptional regulator, AcrR family [Nonomuraea solani]|uniref:DNA-binding transcriptional regulator, AcrR family n=1 Tax=Nonomuraea solani TaxID=1144553 RepID=A0A1H5T1E6_9ACTN|nr:TetR/AcrR family transcriptional regulator [Nonomuraea solani]SEF56596.1 DNA-binding transcriptional regulator, AcrR family [Nonomuraea solani]